MRGIERPPWRTRADAHSIVDGTTSRPRQYRLTSRGGPSCRICGGPTLLISGDLCSACWRWSRAEHYVSQEAQLVGNRR